MDRAKSKRKKDAAQKVQVDGFQIIEKDGNKFSILFNKPPEPPTGPFITFKTGRRRVELHKIFRSFVSDDTIKRMIRRINPDNLYYRWRPRPKRVVLSFRKVLLMIALNIRTIGRQIVPKENEKNGDLQIRTMRSLGRELGDGMFGKDVMKRLVPHLLFTCDIMKFVQQNFVQFVEALGENVAGDEKLFYFTAHDHRTRQVPTKPDKIGLWFYELAGRLSNERRFVLYIKLHNNISGTLTTDLIVSDWADIIMQVGRDRVQEGENPNPNTVLACDGYYPTRANVNMLRDSKIPFTASVRYDRFRGFVELLRGENHGKDNVKGESMAMYKPATGEVFVYVFDTQLGQGGEAKYNYSSGFPVEQDQRVINQRRGEIPIYSYYKEMFSECDSFNRRLKDKTWPYHRGGKGLKGALGRINDFYMGIILQNTFNAWLEVNDIDADGISFRALCDILSQSLYAEAIKLADTEFHDENDIEVGEYDLPADFDDDDDDDDN